MSDPATVDCVAVDPSTMSPAEPAYLDFDTMAPGTVITVSDDVLTLGSAITGPSPYVTVVSGGTGTIPGQPYVTMSSPINWNDLVTSTSHHGSLRLQGDGADIDINGVSLKDTLQQIQERLAILQPNAELESRWQQLRDLREQYQIMERDLLEKERAWSMLQSPN